MSETLAEMGSAGAEVAAVEAAPVDPNDVLDSAEMEARKLAAESEASWWAAEELILAESLSKRCVD